MSATAPRGRAPSRPLTSEKARRIVAAMRHSVASCGAPRARPSSGSRARRAYREGLLHYYFGTKEKLLVEAVRHDCELRLERLEGQLAGASTAEAFVGLMAQSLEQTIREEPDFVTLVFELFTLSRRNKDIAVEFAGAAAPHA